jgi:hypothetical protein
MKLSTLLSLPLCLGMVFVAPIGSAQAQNGQDDGGNPGVSRQPVSSVTVRTPNLNDQVPRNRRGQVVYLRDASGNLIARSRYVWFTDQRVAVPVRAYQQLGFRVRQDRRNRQVRISAPNTNIGFTFTVGQRNVLEPNRGGAAEDAIVRYERPMLQQQGGEFYIAAMGLKEYFPDLITTRWDRQTRTVTIQRQPGMTRLLRLMPRD